MRRARWLILVLALAVLAGCAAAPVRTDVTPLERAKMQSLLMMGRYEAQFRDAESLGTLATSGQATLDQVRIYRIKRKLLIDVKPLIDAYDEIVARGEIPTVEREQEIFEILNYLAAKAG